LEEVDVSCHDDKEIIDQIKFLSSNYSLKLNFEMQITNYKNVNIYNIRS